MTTFPVVIGQFKCIEVHTLDYWHWGLPGCNICGTSLIYFSYGLLQIWWCPKRTQVFPSTSVQGRLFKLVSYFSGKASTVHPTCTAHIFKLMIHHRFCLPIFFCFQDSIHRANKTQVTGPRLSSLSTQYRSKHHPLILRRHDIFFFLCPYIGDVFSLSLSRSDSTILYLKTALSALVPIFWSRMKNASNIPQTGQ